MIRSNLSAGFGLDFYLWCPVGHSWTLSILDRGMKPESWGGVEAIILEKRRVFSRYKLVNLRNSNKYRISFDCCSIFYILFNTKEHRNNQSCLLIYDCLCGSVSARISVIVRLFLCICVTVWISYTYELEVDVNLNAKGKYFRMTTFFFNLLSGIWCLYPKEHNVQ